MLIQTMQETSALEIEQVKEDVREQIKSKQTKVNFVDLEIDKQELREELDKAKKVIQELKISLSAEEGTLLTSNYTIHKLIPKSSFRQSKNDPRRI